MTSTAGGLPAFRGVMMPVILAHSLYHLAQRSSGFCAQNKPRVDYNNLRVAYLPADRHFSMLTADEGRAGITQAIALGVELVAASTFL
jgi:hypothetical protein